MQLLKHFHELSLHPKNAKALKGLILQLAVQGKLTAQWRRGHPELIEGDHSTQTLLGKIRAEKAKLVKEGKIKKEKPLPTISENEIPYELPEEWVWCRLGEYIHNFGQKKPDVEFFYIDVSTIDNIVGGIKQNIPHLIPSDAPSRARKIVKKGCVIYSTVRPYLQNIAIVDKDYEYETIASTAFAVLNLLADCPPKYLFYFLRSEVFKGYVESQMIGVAYPAINDGKLMQGVIPIPPLEEQKAIVKVVEQLFIEVEQLELLSEKRIQLKEQFATSALRDLSTNNSVKEREVLKPHFHTFFNEEPNIKKLRESVLQLAVQGKLTAHWRRRQQKISHPGEMSEGQGGEGDHSAKALLEKIKAEKAKLVKEGKIKKEKPLPPITDKEIPYELPEGWVWCKVNDVCPKVTDGFHNTPKKIQDGYKYISATHIKEGGILWDDCLYVGQKDHSELYKKAYPQKGEILIVNRGAGCGTPAIIDIQEQFSFQNAALIGFNQDLINSHFMFYYILQKRTEIMDFFTNGGAQPMLSNKILKTLTFPLPSFEEQKAIVETVNRLMHLCDQLEEQVKLSKQQVGDWMKGSLREVIKKKKHN
jgi:type I restriction enzyme, S subunit